MLKMDQGLSRMRPRLLFKWLLWSLFLGGLLALAIWYFGFHRASVGKGDVWGRGGRNAATVGIAVAEKTDIPIVINAMGTVVTTATANVRPQVSGVLQQVNFQEGQVVKAGQLLATIDPRQFELALLQASGQLQRDQAQLDNARQILKRDLVLQSQDSIAQQDVEAQATLVKQLEGTVMTDRAQEGNARLNLSYTKVLAPISGRIGLRAVDVGNLVSANDTTALAVITQLEPIDIIFSVPQAQVADIQAELAAVDPGQTKVSALDSARAKNLAEGHFLALDNQVDTQTGTVRAKARFENTNQALFPNQFVNVQMVLRTLKDAVQIPVSALRHGSKGDFVYVLDGESLTVALRPVKTGQAGVDKVQITSGLQLGEKVITEGADKLKDGAKVKLPGEQPVGAEQHKPWQAGVKPVDDKPGEERKRDWKNRAGKDAGAKDWKNKGSEQ